MLSFIQINLHKASQATLMLGGQFEGKNQMVALITEPYTYKNKITGMPKGVKIVSAKLKESEPGPRAGIASSVDLKITAMDNWCSRDCAVALTTIRGVRTVLVSLYLDINKEIQPAWLGKLMEMITDKGYPVILGVDSNAHSCLYGPENNARGDAFEDFVLQHGLRERTREICQPLK